MFQFLLGFIYVLLYLLVKSSHSSSVIASFNEPCSHNISCNYPLICSNTSRCICSKSISVWDSDRKDCLYCPPGWIEWENNHCLSLSVPMEGGFTYDQANNTCQSFSAELFYVYNIEQFKQFQSKINPLFRSIYSSAVTIFFRLGAWIDRINIHGLNEIWCDGKDVNSNFGCIYMKRQNLKNGSLCLSRLDCNEQMPFICDMPAISEKYTADNANAGSSDQRFLDVLTALAPAALGFLGNLLGVTTPTPPAPIIIQQPVPVAESSDDMILYIALFIGGFILLIIICCGVGAVIYFTGCLKNSSDNEDIERSRSYDSSSSEG